MPLKNRSNKPDIVLPIIQVVATGDVPPETCQQPHPVAMQVVAKLLMVARVHVVRVVHVEVIPHHRSYCVATPTAATLQIPLKCFYLNYEKLF